MTVSTDKVTKIKQTLGEGIVDQVSSLDQFNADKADNRLVIDYKKTDVLKVIPCRSINFLIDAIGAGLSLVSFQPPDCFTKLICRLRDQA